MTLAVSDRDRDDYQIGIDANFGPRFEIYIREHRSTGLGPQRLRGNGPLLSVIGPGANDQERASQNIEPSLAISAERVERISRVPHTRSDATVQGQAYFLPFLVTVSLRAKAADVPCEGSPEQRSFYSVIPAGSRDSRMSGHSSCASGSIADSDIRCRTGNNTALDGVGQGKVHRETARS